MLKRMAGVPGFEPGNARIKTWCRTAGDTPTKEMVATTGFEPVTNIMSVVL